MHVREIPNSLPMPLQDGTSRVLVFFGSDCRVGGLDAHIEGLGELQSIFSKCLVVLEHHVYISISPYIYIYINMQMQLGIQASDELYTETLATLTKATKLLTHHMTGSQNAKKRFEAITTA